MIRVSTKVRDYEILRMYNDGVHVKRIAQFLHVSRWIVYRAILRERRVSPCRDCPNNPYRRHEDQIAKLRQ